MCMCLYVWSNKRINKISRLCRYMYVVNKLLKFTDKVLSRVCFLSKLFCFTTIFYSARIEERPDLATRSAPGSVIDSQPRRTDDLQSWCSTWTCSEPTREAIRRLSANVKGRGLKMWRWSTNWSLPIRNGGNVRKRILIPAASGAPSANGLASANNTETTTVLVFSTKYVIDGASQNATLYFTSYM